MNVWWVYHYADPPTGMATRSFDIAHHLISRGFDFTIFSSNFNYYSLRNTRNLGHRLWTYETIEGIRFAWLKTPSYRRSKARRVLNMLVFGFVTVCCGVVSRERPDVVIGVTVHPMAALAAWILSKLKRARFVLEVTDLWPESLVEFGHVSRGSLVTKVLLLVER